MKHAALATSSACALALLLAAASQIFAGPSAQERSRGGDERARPAGPAAGRGATPGQQGGEGKAEEEATPAPPAPEPDMTVADRYFATCDYNKDGWVSYREASQALELDQVRFSAYDKGPRDGRITRDEFRKVYGESVRSLGSFRPPLPDPALGLATEIEPPAPLDPAPSELAPPTSVVELFGRAEPRPNQEEVVPQPPLIRGPVPVFRRLDLDESGAVTDADLLELLRPLQVSVRVRAVIASIDADGDGSVSHDELRASMRGGPRRTAR